MSRFPARFLLIGSVLAVLGCEEEMITLDSGTPSTLAVRVYVDADGNGVYTPGADQALSAASISADGPGGQFSESTGSDGVATFAELSAGSYTLSVAGGAPTGSVLTTASTPVVVAPFRGTTLESEFRYAFLPGSISGRLYRDDDENGAFDPGADLAAAGIQITLSDGQGSSVSGPSSTAGSRAVVATTTTDGTGFYSFDGLRPGTYTLEVEALETMEILGGASQTVMVEPDVQTSFEVVFTGTLVIDIADARAAPNGQTVTVEAVVTWHPAFDTRQYFFQDGTGGMSSFDNNRPAIALGDRVRITGSKGGFRGEVQISPVTAIEVVGFDGEPDPRPVTGAEINAGMFQAELVTLDGTVLDVALQSFGNQMVTLQDASGTEFMVSVDSRTGVEEDSWTVGETYAVTGVVGNDDRNDPAARIEPRGLDDLVEGGSTIDIADARGMVGETVVVEGIVTWQAQWDARVYFFQDATGGFAVFDGSSPTLQMGDRVLVRGTVSQFRGETQISPQNLQVLGNEAVPSPMGVTGEDINGGLFQGQLVTLSGTVQTVDVFNFDSHNVTIRDGSGTDFSAFVDSRTGVGSADWTVGETVRVSGVLGTDDRNDPAPRLEPRMPDDRVAAAAGQISLAEARYRSGETVVVEGVVTWQTQWDTRIYFFEDATAGISTFQTGAPTLNEGDRIRVTGDVTAFRGETQIGSITNVEVVETGDPIDPLVVTGKQINDGSFQGRLVQATGTVVDVNVVNNFDTHVVTLRDGSGTDFTAYVDNRTTIPSGDWTVDETVTVVGVLGTDDRNDPAPRLEPRRPEDLNPTS